MEIIRHGTVDGVRHIDAPIVLVGRTLECERCGCKLRIKKNDLRSINIKCWPADDNAKRRVKKVFVRIEIKCPDCENNLMVEDLIAVK